MNSLPKTVTRQRRGCDLNPGPTAPESSTLTTRLPSHPVFDRNIIFLSVVPIFVEHYLLALAEMSLEIYLCVSLYRLFSMILSRWRW